MTSYWQNINKSGSRVRSRDPVLTYQAGSPHIEVGPVRRSPGRICIAVNLSSQGFTATLFSVIPTPRYGDSQISLKTLQIGGF